MSGHDGKNPNRLPQGQALIPDERVALGQSGVYVTRLGAGLAPIGGLYRAVGDAEAAATIDAAFAAGIRLFDTAPLYGYGLSEQRLGTALAGRSGYVISSKVGRVLVPVSTSGPSDAVWASSTGQVTAEFDFSAAGVRRSLESSLQRLGVAKLDIVHLHDPDNHLRQAVREAYPQLLRARDEGLVGAIGAGANSARTLAQLIRDIDLDVVMLAGRYTLLDRSGAALLDLAARRGVAVIAAGVFNSGLLADPRPGATFDYAPAADDLVARAVALRDRCAAFGVPLRAAATQFPARHPAVAAVLVGVRSPDEVADAVAAARFPIPDALWQDLL